VDRFAYVHERAREATGLSDFGDDGYQEGLRQFLAAAEEIPDADTRQMAAEAAVGPLAGRLHSEAGWKQRPDCLSDPVPSVVLITGIPRTGTTALHKLLATDARFQVVESWLIPAPGVRPPRETWATDPRYEAAVVAAAQLPPEFRTAHFTAPDEADECLAVLAQSFVTNLFGSTLPIPAYDEWMLLQDMRPTYARYADNLRLIGADAPGRPWLLKNPSTMLSIDAFLAVFNGARVLQTQRDPFEAMASLASVLTAVRTQLGVETASVADRELHIWSEAARRASAVREQCGDAFFDVRYESLVEDPMATVSGIYRWLEFELTDTVATAMVRWLDENPPHKHGEHEYAPDEYGITRELIEQQFGDTGR
jgi:hypothetical protein